jgi:hypothetical protein
MGPPAALVQFVEPWSKLYGDSRVIPTLVVFAHIAALVFAGGLAVTMDRATMRVSRGPAEFRWRQLEELARAHRTVVVGLGLSVVSGLLLFLADLETYFVSPIFWTKMSLIVLMLMNGYLMTKTETRIRLTPGAEDDAGWKRLRTSAALSMGLWFVVAFVGVALAMAA